MIVEVSFYSESNGNEPVRKWLKSLEKEVRSIIGRDICTVQQGWPLGMPLVDSLGSGLWEVRTVIPNGIARVLFVMKDGHMVLLHGFIKKTNKTPPQDRATALRRAKNIG
ncbi:MAG: type II toxin-antitoxin system RelE/ParE family toxin [Verrucomicrobia bacterium]|nr:type II toxin-antitoxin system RelE/ParE family toxin [Verrucomicrobiota bacterium]